MKSILQDTEDFGLFFDRTTQVYDNLPYNLEDVLIAPNEFVKINTINKKIYNLHYNFLFLYKLCNFGNFEVPKTENFSFSASDAVFFEEKSNTYVVTSNTDLLQSNSCALSYYRPNKAGTVLFYATKTFLYSLVYEQYKIEPLTKTSFIDPLSGSITFRNITQLKTNRNGDLYLVDNDYKNLLYYNVNTVLEGESIYRSLPFLKNVIGGAGVAEEKSKFNNINNIGVNDAYVVVEDNINKCFKLFDRFLNWLDTTKFISLFNKIQKFEAVTLSPDNKIYAIAKQTLYTFNIESNFNIVLDEMFDISSYILQNEIILNLRFSYDEPKCFFVFTDLGVCKVWSTNPTGCIGKFKSGDKIVWGDVFVANNDQGDSLIIKTQTKNNVGTFKLRGFTDSLSIETLLVNRDFDIFGYDEIKLNEEEYVSNWTYQKIFKKLYYNSLALIKEVKFRLFEDNTGETSIIIDKIYNQLFLNYTQPLPDPINLNVGVNELFQAEVLNRLISEIYRQQITILLYVVNNEKTRQYLSPDPSRKNKNVITYTYFSDDSINLFPEPAKLKVLEELAPLDGIVLSLGGAPYVGGDGISIIPGAET